MKVVALVFCTVMSLKGIVFGATTAWKGESGKWSDPTMWDNGVPTKDVRANFSYLADKPEGYTVEIDVDDAACQGFYISDANTGPANKTCPVTFTGSGRLTLGKGGDVYWHRPSIIDGPTLVAENGMIIREDFTIRSGTVVSTNSGMSVWFSTYRDSNPQLYMQGGQWITRRLSIAEAPATVIYQSGGLLQVNTEFNLKTTLAQQTELRGGTFCFRDGTLAVGKKNETNHYNFASATIKCATFSVQGGAGSIAAGASHSYFHDAPVFVLKTTFSKPSWGPYLFFHHGLRFGSYGDWAENNLWNGEVFETMDFDTLDYDDRTTTHAITGWDSGFRPSNRAVVRVRGGGSVSAKNLTSGCMPQLLDALRLEDGSDLNLTTQKKDYTNNRIRTEELYMSEDSTFQLLANSQYLSATHSVFEPGATFVANMPTDKAVALTANSFPILFAGPTSSVANVNVELVGEGAEKYQVVKQNNIALMWDGTDLTYDKTSGSQWCGLGEDDNFTTAANWSAGSYSRTNEKTLILKTRRGFMNIDDTTSFYRLEQSAGSWGMTITGNLFKISSPNMGGSYSAFCNRTCYPLVFGCSVKCTSKAGTAAVAGYDSQVSSSISFLGGFDCGTTLDVQGPIYFGGKDNTISEVWLRNNKGSYAAIEVLDGGRVFVTNQNLNCYVNGNNLNYNADSNVYWTASSYLRVDNGGEMRFCSNGVLRVKNAHQFHVNGTLAIEIPFTSVDGQRQTFAGYGRLELKNPTVDPSKDFAVRIQERLMCYPGDWKTAVTSAPSRKMPLEVYTHATLGALQDWTYGPEAGAEPTTTAAERALTVSPYETLTVDTQSPDDGVAHTVTFADPIVAPNGYLVKKGAGTLVLASADNDLATSEVTVEGGTLTWTVPQTFGKFAVKPGANLLIDAKDGALLTLELGEQDFDAEDVGVTLSEDAQDVAGLDWTTVATVGEGHVITGMPVACEGWKTQIVALDDGGQALQCKKRGGAMLIIR